MTAVTSPTPGVSVEAVGASGRTPRRILVLVLIVIALSAGVRLADLARYRGTVFDEYYYVHDAKVVAGADLGGSSGEPWKPRALRSDSHPDLAKLAIAAGIAVVGDDAWGWRVPSALAGTALIALVFPLARRMGLSAQWSLAALVLVASDPMLMLESRLALLDIFVGLFTALAVYLALRFVQSGCAYGWLLGCGVAVGAGVASKWSGLLAVLAVAVVLAPRLRAPRRLVVGWPKVALALVAVPLAVYVAASAPYFISGHGPGDWLHLQAHMATFGWNVQGDRSFASAAITWPFDVHPIWYRWAESEKGTSGLLAIGNPLLWWGASAAWVVLGVLAILRRDLRTGLAPLLVAVLYLPWLLTSRQSYIYYMVPVIPFMGVLLATALCRIAGDDLAPWTGEAAAMIEPPPAHLWRRGLAWAACLGCAAAGLLYLPFVLGVPVAFDYYRLVTPLTTWR